MSVATGIAPTALLELDWPWLEAVELAAVERQRAHARRWGPLEAMLADLLELTHASYVAYLATHLKKGARLPSPIKVPRPNADGEWPQDAKPAPLSPAAFAAAFAPSSSASSSSRGSPRG